MKLNKKVLGLVLGGLMSICLVGCNKTDKAEEIILENIENTIEANLEEYEGKYDYLDSKQQLSIDTARIINIDKSKVEIKELEKVYEIILTLRLEYDNELFENNIYIMEIDKDKFDFEMLKDTDLIYNDDINVVGYKVVRDGEVKRRCFSKEYSNDGIYDSYTLKEMLKDDLGDINTDW